MIKIALIQFPDGLIPAGKMISEISAAISKANMQPVILSRCDDPALLESFDGFILAGHFPISRSRAGLLAELDPLLRALRGQTESGKPVLGIGYGAHILVESGLVPGLFDYATALAVITNQPSSDGHDTEVYIKLADNEPLTAFTKSLSSRQLLKMSAETRMGFVMSTVLLHELKSQGLLVFQYCDHRGSLLNPLPMHSNGLVNNIAAISNRAGNVLALLPHLGQDQSGQVIFQSMQKYIEKGPVQSVGPLRYFSRPPLRPIYQRPSMIHEYIIGSKVSDEMIEPVKQWLKRQGIHIELERYRHLEMIEDNNEFEPLERVNAIFNPQQEYILNGFIKGRDPVKCLLVQPKSFFSENAKKIREGEIWVIKGLHDQIDAAIGSGIFYNPYSQIASDYLERS